MQKIILPVCIICLLVACKKETTSTMQLNEMVDTTALVQLKGSFMNGPWGSVSGNAKIIKQNTTYQLQLDTFMSSNGPDLKVYLSKEVQPVNFINLGSLKSSNGTQLYNIPAGVNFNEYKYALVHCQQYNHLFGSAELKP